MCVSSLVNNEVFSLAQKEMHFLFLGFGSNKKRNCVRQARARSISNTSTHMFTAAVCARGGAAAGWIEKVSRMQRNTLQSWAEARAAVSLIGLLAV